MTIDLSGQNILITGATQGLGACIAREAARRGAARIGIAGRNPERGAAVAAEVSDLGAACRFFACDLSDAAQSAQLFADMLDWSPQVHGLVNSAGLTDRGGFVDGDAALFDRLFAVNTRAPFLLMQAMIQHCRDAGQGGSIVNISSMNAHCGTGELGIYSATKGALNTLTRNAANAHLAEGIRVNAINMGWAATDAEIKMQSETLGGGEDWLRAAAARVPLGRLLQVQEVAQLCTYLLSDYAGLQTGTLIDLEQKVVGAP